jgi:hypothetical protein
VVTATPNPANQTISAAPVVVPDEISVFVAARLPHRRTDKVIEAGERGP